MWAKICGIRDVSTANAVAALRPDAIGLNFFAKSPRVVAVEEAAAIVRAIPAGIEPVGVFVNHAVDEIESIVKRTGIQCVQLHGDETPAMLAQLTARLSNTEFIRAFRMGEAGLRPLSDYLRECRERGVTLKAVLVDALVAGQFGGTGKTVPWNILCEEYHNDWPPLILAGGLTPDNVREAIRATESWGVDVAGGVESSPGVKDLALVERFLAEARR